MNEFIRTVFKETVDICIPLFRILVPMIIVIKILKETGLVDMLGVVLKPLMFMAGLPGEMGLAWASALATNLYGGLIAFAALAPGHEMTVAQVTVLCSIMLMAHGFPIELQISKKAGTRLRAMLSFRFIAALIFGVLLNAFYRYFDLLQQPATIFYAPQQGNTTIPAWALGELRNLVYISLVILALVILMKILKKLGIITLINKACKPMLKIMGIGEQAAYVTMVGFTLGLTYGGGLIIREAKSGSMSHRDVFFSLGFMGICHSMVEDTVLMVAIGGDIFGILVLRTAFCILFVALLVRLTQFLPDRVFYRHLFVNR